VVALAGVTVPLGVAAPFAEQVPPMGIVVVALRPQMGGLPAISPQPPAWNVVACETHEFACASE